MAHGLKDEAVVFGELYRDEPVLSTPVVKSAFELPFPATLDRGWRSLTGRSWSAHAKIRSVEVSFREDGPFWPAHVHRLGGDDPQAWAQWSIAWPATVGELVLRARATDYLGNTQTTGPVPFNMQGYLFGVTVGYPVTVV